MTARQAQEEQQPGGNASRSSRRGHTSTTKGSAPEPAGPVRDINVEVISLMLQALEKEHKGLVNTLQGPIIAFIMDMLPVGGYAQHGWTDNVCLHYGRGGFTTGGGKSARQAGGWAHTWAPFLWVACCMIWPCTPGCSASLRLALTLAVWA